MPDFSRRKHRSSYFLNSATSSSNMSTQKASVGERLSMDCVVEGTVAWSVVSYSAISVWWMAVTRIPSDSWPLTIRGPTMAW
jgi:hypothetical protein